jgi:carbonic anhydrase
MSQSPIDIITADTQVVSDSSFSAVSIDVPPQVMPEIDFGIYSMYESNGTLNAVLDNVTFDLFLTQVNVHIQAGNLIDGVRYPMELHVNFYPRTNDTNLQEFMLLLLFQEGSRSQFIDGLLNGGVADLSTLISSPIEDYFYYSGSRDVPAPDCVEPVLYVIVNQVFSLGADQLQDLMNGPYGRGFAASGGHGLYRETQPLNGRTVYHRVPETNSFLAVILE